MNGELGSLVATALVTAIVSGMVNFLGWMLLRRSIERQDADIDQQRRELQTLRDERVATLANRMAEFERESSVKSRGIYERLNAAVRPDEFTRRTDAIDVSVRAVADDLSLLRSDLAAQGAILKLIAGNMGIHFNGGPA